MKFELDKSGIEKILSGSPVDFFLRFIDIDSFGYDGLKTILREYEKWFFERGQSYSDSVDRHRTPWLKMFDETGKRVDEIQYPSEYWELLYEGYRRGIIDMVFQYDSVIPFYLMLYIVTFFDAGLGCPYTVSLSTALPISKYGSSALKDEIIPKMRIRGAEVWQGATWMTEIKGGSDLGYTVETEAYEAGDGRWILNGDKYFSSNVGAQVAVVAARPKGSSKDVRGLSLFVVKKFRKDGSLNYFVRRLKNKIGTRSVPTGEVELRNTEAYLLGKREWGIYEILDVLNSSRLSNIFGSVAVIQRALNLAYKFASQRFAFGRYVFEHPLMLKQFRQRTYELLKCFNMAWDAVKIYNEVFKEVPPFSDRFLLFRILSHISKYYTAEVAIQTSKWAMEVWGGLGILEEFPVERLFRESIILSIWEGTPHRQMLDGLETIAKKNSHKLLFDFLREKFRGDEFKMKNLKEVEDYTERFLDLPDNKKEEEVEELFVKIAGLWG